MNYLAGFVLAEAYFLKLILEFRGISMRGNAGKKLTNSVVGSITAFCNPYFFGNYLSSVQFGVYSCLFGVFSH